MKFSFSAFVVLVLTVVMLGQVGMSTYTSVLESYNIESPLEEYPDEDSDNEVELDKYVQQITERLEVAVNSVSHKTFYEANLSDLIREIIPPPPKS